MLTVEDVLRMEAFAGAVLAAGHNGLHKPVEWAHNVGVPDAANWLNGGELVLTTVINMPESAEERCHYIQHLADKGVVALAIGVGRYIDRIPDDWRQVANANNFPLIEIPYQRRFVDVVRAVNERISEESIFVFRRAMQINQVLTRLILDGGNLVDLSNVLADLLGQSISIESDQFEAIASTNIAEVDEARRYTLQHGRTNPRLLQALENAGYLRELRQTRRSVALPRLPEVGLEMERILAPVVIHGEIYGYMWIIADGSPLTDLETLALEIGATVAALMMLHQETRQNAEASLKGSLLSQLIRGEPDRERVLTDQALRYGVDLQHPYHLLMLDFVPDERLTVAQAVRHLARLVAAHEIHAVVGQFAGQVLVLANATQSSAAIAELASTAAASANLRVGISAQQRGSSSLPQAYSQCQEVLDIARRLNDPKRTCAFDALGYLHTLYHAGTGALRGNPYLPALHELQAEVQADLFHTLEVYLDMGGNGVGTADALHIHRSTLNYRLQRIEQITAASLADPITRTNLQVALKLLRLFGTENGSHDL